MPFFSGPSDTASAGADDLDLGLAKLGYSGFRPGQREAIEVLLRARRLLLVAPTGGGKSLIYQLPATLLPGTALVISPLVALMQDQVRALDEMGVASTFLASVLTTHESQERLAGLANGRYKIVYAAPERLSFPGFRGLLRKMSLSMVAIDEAHCISEWGHDFRPEYLQIGDFLRELAPPRILACTATATPVVRDEICQRLGFGSDVPQLVRGFARPNLVLRASEICSSKERHAAVNGILRESLRAPGSGAGAAIVYAPTRRGAEEEAARLRDQGWLADAYHAGLPPDQRQKVQERFSNRELEVAVATNAFGMGIDRSDVRSVVHLAPPSSVEAYYQEVGRAGRDGQRSFGLILCSMQDLALRRRLIAQPADAKNGDSQVVEHKWSLFLELVRWFESSECRHDGLLRYFGDEGEILGGCGLCDNCLRVDDLEVATGAAANEIIRKVLSGVARVHGRFGLTGAQALLLGRPDERLRNAGLDQVSTFGLLSGEAEDWLHRIFRRCIAAGLISFSSDQRPVVYLTAAGMAAMRGEVPAHVELPPRPGRAIPPVEASKRAPKNAGRALAVASVDADLMAALRSERMRLARDLSVPPYVIASDRTLIELCDLKPRSLGELRAVYGMGETRIERYGQALLRVLVGFSGA
jgi:ATP-dependent DNA helicase RecQ